MNRWRGLKDLVADAVHHGATAIERVQKEVSRRPFDLLEAVPPLEVPVHAVRVVHDAVVSTVYASIRGVNGLARHSADIVFDILDAKRTAPPTDAGEPKPPADH